MPRAAILLSIFSVAVAAYLPAVDNFFISDDFTLLEFLKALERDPLHILGVPLEVFRLASYVYFMLCYKLFGLNSAAYYSAGILLHAVISLLVYLLVARISGDERAGWAAAIFFAAYERHQEAVMWISAANETILALNFLLCLLCWERYLGSGSLRLIRYGATLVIFAVSLFSKEPAVTLLPLMASMQALKQDGSYSASLYSWRNLARYLPFFLLTAAYLALWFSQRNVNPFITSGAYSFGAHFFPIYARSLARLLFQASLFIALLVCFRLLDNNERGDNALLSLSDSASHLLRNPALVFFTELLFVSTAPYCFLTYLDHIPSRNTYLPSVGLAGLVGVLVCGLYRQLRASEVRRALVISFFLAVVSANVIYIWARKEAQFRERAAPTRELIGFLDRTDVSLRGRRVYVYGFPLHEVIGKAAIEIFTSFPASQVVFADESQAPPDDSLILRWDQRHGRFDSFDAQVQGTTQQN